MAAIIESEADGSGVMGSLAKLAQADFDVTGTPYERFIEEYFRDGTPF